MKTLEVYIACHNKKSFDHFQEINQDAPQKDRFRYLLVGMHESIPEWMPQDRTIVACLLSDHMEAYKSLLTFTAWYALTRNGIIKSDFVAILEYDCEIKKDLFQLALHSNTITGFLYRDLPDMMYLECMPKFEALLSPQEKEHALTKGFWCPTTNFVVSPLFLSNFVTWFLDFIPQIITVKNHPHFHERAIHVFAINHGVQVQFADQYLMHEQLCSHGIDYDAE